MNYIKIAIIALISLSIFAACDRSQNGKTPATSDKIPQKKEVKLNSIILGERLNADTKVYDKPGGSELFTLKAGTLISCCQVKNGYYKIGVIADLNSDEFRIDSLAKNRELIYNGASIGKMTTTLQASTSSDGKKVTAELIGYINAKNLDENTIIERVFENYYSNLNSKNFKEFNKFIDAFKLDYYDSFPGFNCYGSLDTWIDDPSPVYRFVLVFENNNFLGIVAARKINLQNTETIQLKRGFSLIYDKNVNKIKLNDFVKSFNNFIQSVD